MTWWIGIVVVPSTTIRSTVDFIESWPLLNRRTVTRCLDSTRFRPDHVMVSQWLMTAKASI